MCTKFSAFFHKMHNRLSISDYAAGLYQLCVVLCLAVVLFLVHLAGAVFCFTMVYSGSIPVFTVYPFISQMPLTEQS